MAPAILPFETGRLIVRNWRDGDQPLFHEINSDERVMEFFPMRRNRAQSDELMARLAGMIETAGYGFAAIERRDTGECLGFVGIQDAALAPLFPADMVEIGWRLAERHWGRGYVTEAARAWLDRGFGTLGLAEIVSFAVAGNCRSTAVMERLGMRRDAGRDFDHPRIPDDRPDLKRHVFHALSREAWQQRVG